MLSEWRRLIEAIHAAPHRCVIVVTGGGASAISQLLSVPGGSRTVLEAAVPYSSAALAGWLGRRPEKFCSEETALAMAAVAYERGLRWEKDEAANGAGTQVDSRVAPGEPVTSAVIGISCTASLASDRPKKGDHRCHIAVQTPSATISTTVTLQKGARDRLDEEELTGQLISRCLAAAAGVAIVPAIGLMPTEPIVEHRADADRRLIDLRTGIRNIVWSIPGGGWRESLEQERYAGATGDRADRERAAGDCYPLPRGVLCGAFNPLHHGHEELRRIAQERLQGAVYYEMSLRNVDKPPLDYLTIDRRRAQFCQEPLALTMAPTFAEKARALPGVVFVVGVDTAERIINPKYYHGSEEELREALAVIREQRCRFLVAGRKCADRFQTLEDLAVPSEFADLFEAIPPEAFRADVSSTELRQAVAR